MITNNDNFLFFGNYPQTIKAEEVVIDKSETYRINFWSCFKGNDNHYYIEETVSNPNNLNCSDISLSNGRKVTLGEKLYFMMEPVKWNILDDGHSDTMFLLSEKVLDCCFFDNHYRDEILMERKIKNTKILPPNYEYSNVRAFLNGLNGKDYDVCDFSNKGFIDKAFTKSEQNQIKTTFCDNGILSFVSNDMINTPLYNIINSTLYNSNNTYDKVFLLSHNEIEKLDKIHKAKTATDYALVKGAPTIFSKNNFSYWWLRSPSWTDMYGVDKVEAAFVNPEGCSDVGINVGFFNGIVPGICI